METTPKENLLSRAASRNDIFVDKNDVMYPYIINQSVENDRIFRNGTMAQSLGHFTMSGEESKNSK